MNDLLSYIEVVPDYPKAGVLFRDISPLLRHRLRQAVEAFDALLTETEWRDVDVIVGIESRGFIFASALAHHRGKGLALIRKAGKMPNCAASVLADLEYGQAVLEMQHGKGRAIVVDDVLATGGTFKAAGDLCTRAGYQVQGFCVLLDLRYLNHFEWNGMRAKAVLECDA